MSTVVKELLVKFNGDTKGIDGASTRAKSAIDSVSKGIKIATAAAGALAVGFGVLAAKQSQLGDELGKTSDRIGISTEKLAAYYHAADLAGISSEAFNNSIKFMFKNAVEAASGNEQLGAAFSALGINVKDFMALSSDQQFEMLAQRISEIESPAVRSAVAMKIFGRSGDQMLNMIKDGTGSLTLAADETKRFGLEISRIDAAQLEAANDAVLKVGAAAGGAARQFAVGLSPAITTVIEDLLSTTDAGQAFREVGEKIGETFVAAFDLIRVAIDSVHKQFLEFSEGFYRLQAEVQSGLPEKVQDMLGLDPAAARQSADKIMDEVDKLDRRINDRTQGTGDSMLGKYHKQVMGVSSKSPSKGISSKDLSILTALDTQAATKALKDHDEAAKKAKQAQIDYNNSVADSFIGMKDQMMESGSILDNFKKVALNAINEILNNVIRLSVGGTMQSGGGLFGGISQSIAGSIGGFAKNLFGFAQGGSFKVGGDGATDSSLVAFKATRGEQVTVTRPDQQMAGGGGISIVQNISIGAGVSGAVRQELAKMMPDIKRATIAGVEDAKMRGAIA